LAGGIFHVLAGTVLFSSAIVAMFNATWIAVLLFLWKPKCSKVIKK
jgi:hypothetical protein